MAPELELVVLRVENVDRAAMFYRALGLTLIEEQHGTGPRHFSAQLGGVTFELYPRESAATEGLRVGLRVTDVEGCIASAVAKGGRLLADGVTIVDPDGHRIALRAMNRPTR